MHTVRRLLTILFIALFGLSTLAPTEALEATAIAQTASPNGPAVAASDATARLLDAARGLKNTRPELFGKSQGVLVIEVVPGSQGAAAGLAPGDILIGYGEAALDSVSQLVALTGATPGEQTLALRLVRHGDAMDIPIHGGRLGVVIHDLVPSPAELAQPRIKALTGDLLTAFAQGRSGDALAAAKELLSLAESVKNPGVQVLTHGLVAEIHESLGQHDDAVSHAQQAQAIAREIADPKTQAELARVLARIASINPTTAGVPAATSKSLSTLREAARALRKERPELFGKSQGLLVTAVGPGSRGVAAGFASGDILITYGDAALDSARQLIALSKAAPVERAMVVRLLRHGEVIELPLQGGPLDVAVTDLAPSAFEAAMDRLQAHVNACTTAMSPGRYAEAMAYCQEGLALAEEQGNRFFQSMFLVLIAVLDEALGNYDQALSDAKRALTGLSISDNPKEFAMVLKILGTLGVRHGYYTEALATLDKALVVFRETHDRRAEAQTLMVIAVIYQNVGRYHDAVRDDEQALAIARAIGDQEIEAEALSNLGLDYFRLNRYQDALAREEQALAMSRLINYRVGEATALGIIGGIQMELGHYQEALCRLEQMLAVTRELSDLSVEGSTTGNLGTVYHHLGRYQDARDRYERALAIARQTRNRASEGRMLANLGLIDSFLGQHQDALAQGERALAIVRDIGDRGTEAAVLHNMGVAHVGLGQYQEASELYAQSLAIAQTIGSRAGESRNLAHLARVRDKQGNNDEAIGDYKQALAVEATIGNTDALAGYWSSLSDLWTNRGQSGPAILAGKNAVNILQTIRAVNSGLDQPLQSSFLQAPGVFGQSRASVYRNLADRLAAQGRLADAQQVLDMLKENEFYDYIKGAEGFDARRTRVALNAREMDWQQGFDRVACELKQIGEQLADLERIKPEARTEAEQARLLDLQSQRDRLAIQLKKTLDDLVTRFAKQAPKAQANLAAQMVRLPGNKRALLADLSARSGSRTGLLQFIALPDKVRILLTTPDGWEQAIETVDSPTLNAEIDALRQALTAPTSEVKAPAQALYNRLVAPLADKIEAAKLQTVLVYLDGRLRYIPFAALYDGKHWLAERWPLVYYTAASERREALKDTHWRVAGLGTSKAHPGYAALPAVRGELTGIVLGPESPTGVLPGKVYLDPDFTRKALYRSAADDYSILHIATHFALKPGDDSQSSLLLGTGELLSLRTLREAGLQLLHVDLVTLSACNTALGGADAQGAEIEGMGSVMQHQGARGVLASLWTVADASTGQLMQTFYRLRSERPELTKAQALQQAQLALMGSDLAQTSATRGEPKRDWVPDGGESKPEGAASGDPGQATGRYAHPYYWVPFVLMGNWL